MHPLTLVYSKLYMSPICPPDKSENIILPGNVDPGFESFNNPTVATEPSGLYNV